MKHQLYTQPSFHKKEKVGRLFISWCLLQPSHGDLPKSQLWLTALSPSYKFCHDAKGLGSIPGRGEVFQGIFPSTGFEKTGKLHIKREFLLCSAWRKWSKQG